MPPRSRLPLPTRIPALFLALAVLVTGLSVPSFAQAQEPSYRPWSLRDLFFPRREPRYYEPPAEVPAARSKRRTKPKVRKSNEGAAITKPRSAAPAEPAAPAAVEKQDDAKVVLVIGDFLGGGLADGLDTVYAQNPKVRVIDRTKGSSGFVRDDYYDWPKEAGALLDAEKPAVVVVMLGSNDRQQMRVAGVSETPRSDNWTREYERRAEALAKVISDRKIPFVWVGVPAFKFSKMTADMLAFNDVYHAAADTAGAEFVDVWDGFVDENGAFVINGPDVEGQPVRLRSDDGINFTKAGKRKLAFYAEKPLNKILGVTETPAAGLSAPASGTATDLKNAAPVDRTAPISLNDPALDGGNELLGAQMEVKPETSDSPGGKLLVKGIASAPSPGRADDFMLPPGWTPPPTVAARRGKPVITAAP
ncbi:DUF459 domain-containing protein [Pseudaminobacter salicylatoxidans]|uniref:SGNH/GDSL hydrolase family protein n=1 Tax=Pseudaminobacter salicylatoxidans TaxID=93369 RepID=UPI000685A512|nr:DUF459 domain-containing protein [Pseudaminobacter salicylatoxidans]